MDTNKSANDQSKHTKQHLSHTRCMRKADRQLTQPMFKCIIPSTVMLTQHRIYQFDLLILFMTNAGGWP